MFRIRAAEQRVFKESGLASWLETKRLLVQPVGWCALRIFFLLRTRRRESSKHVYFLCSPSRDLSHNMVKAKHVPSRKLPGFLAVDGCLFSSQFRHIVDYFYLGYVFFPYLGDLGIDER
jgi:hypothetical protein